MADQGAVVAVAHEPTQRFDPAKRPRAVQADAGAGVGMLVQQRGATSTQIADANRLAQRVVHGQPRPLGNPQERGALYFQLP